MKNFLIGYVKDVKETKPDGVISFSFTKRVVDRDSEVVEPAGADLKNFKKNPVFLWAHDNRSPAIGKVLTGTIKQSELELEGDVEFDMEDDFAVKIYNKYKKKFLNAVSIRFISKQYGEEPVLPGQRRGTILKWELLEVSAVPIPANQLALAKALDDGEEVPFKEKIENFLENDNFDKTPEGWVDMLNKSCEVEEEIGEDEEINKEVAENVDDEGVVDEPFDNQKPYPNEHACRLKNPGGYIRFRRTTRKHDGKVYSIIFGIKQDGTVEEQAYRYPKKTWSVAEAKAHCKSHHGITFEPAAGERAHYFENLETAIFNIKDLKEGDNYRVIKNEDDELILERIPTFEETMKEHEFLKPYNLDEWDGVAKAMTDLMNISEEELPEDADAIYEFLAIKYGEFEKEPPEFVNSKEILDSQEERLDKNQDSQEEPEVSEDDIKRIITNEDLIQKLVVLTIQNLLGAKDVKN